MIPKIGTKNNTNIQAKVEEGSFLSRNIMKQEIMKLIIKMMEIALEAIGISVFIICIYSIYD